MAKLYRVIPDATSTVLTTGFLSDITEDLLYKMGYLSCGDTKWGYFGTYEKGKGNCADSTQDYMFFFESPWSCLQALNFFRDPHGKELAKIVEYDISDNIIKASKDAFTNYTNYQAKGKIIPIKLLQKNKEVFTEFSDELKEKLEELATSDAEESIKRLSKSIQESKYSIHKCDSSFEPKGLVERFYGRNLLGKINSRRFEKEVAFFETDIVTGKSILITRADKECLQDVIYRKGTIDSLSEIIENSNGILTRENFNEYDFDEPGYHYGRIISYD